MPILQNIAALKNEEAPVLRCLILVPTRELATQVAKNISHYSRHLNIAHAVAVGGLSAKEQARKIGRGIDILVATSGRLMEHITNKSVDLSSVNQIILDEVDTMLHMGFLEDIEAIFPLASPKRQIMMYSATLNQNVKKLAKEFLVDPVVIEISPQRSTVKIIDQNIIKVDDEKKRELLSFLIGSRNYTQVLVFANTKAGVDEIVESLNLDGLPALAIHGDIKQPARARALRKFKEGEIRVLVATDIAARGIDIEELPYVINYELPESATDYTHRIGRTGRAGKNGVAITLLSTKEYKIMAEIEKELIINISREEIEGYEPTEKAPRMKKPKPKKLSVKKGLKERKPKTKKTTKRDDNRTFRKR